MQKNETPKEVLYAMISPEYGLKEQTLVIGLGEVGKGLVEVLNAAYEVKTLDIKGEVLGFYRVIHICYPYSDKFVDITKEYIARFKPELVIIHSTVKPGTTRKVGDIAVHSPINGRHPTLAQGIKTFVKFVGGMNAYQAFRAVDFLNKAGLRTHVFSSPESCELAKILCTTQYGWFIVLMKEITRIAEEYKVPFHEIYTDWNSAYNDGYLRLGEMRFQRPTLFPLEGEIGGHCVVPNCELLPDFLTDMVKKRNKIYGKRKAK